MSKNFVSRWKESSYSLLFWFESISDEKAKLGDENVARITMIANSKEDRMLAREREIIIRR